MMIRSDLCVEHKNLTDWIITINGKMNVWKCELIFPPDTLQQKIEITDFKPLLAGDFGHHCIRLFLQQWDFRGVQTSEGLNLIKNIIFVMYKSN